MVIVIDWSCETLASVSVKTCTFRNCDYNLTQAITAEHSFVLCAVFKIHEIIGESLRSDHEPVL